MTLNGDEMRLPTSLGAAPCSVARTDAGSPGATSFHPDNSVDLARKTVIEGSGGLSRATLSHHALEARDKSPSLACLNAASSRHQSTDGPRFSGSDSIRNLSAALMTTFGGADQSDFRESSRRVMLANKSEMRHAWLDVLCDG
ncbi:hypothetical protein LA080_005735 [Diaporthe eres]|nr:hypothetical protein LA080_005735 [Diaporthe eres]